jgi:hypothetical protein
MLLWNQLEVEWTVGCVEGFAKAPSGVEVARVSLVKSIVEISATFTLVTFNHSIKILLSPPLPRPAG